MLIQLITQHPEALGTIVQKAPTWVWGLLAALLALGISQLFDRQLTPRRVIVTPIAMLGMALYGIFSAFGNGGQLGAAMLVWLIAAAASTALMLRPPVPAGTGYDARSGQFSVPGSVVPLLLILGIFLTKYAVGVELAMQPMLAHDASFALPIALLYGAFNGIFAGRGLRLLRLLPLAQPLALKLN
jgi:hypothetical protein